MSVSEVLPSGGDEVVLKLTSRAIANLFAYQSVKELRSGVPDTGRADKLYFCPPPNKRFQPAIYEFSVNFP